MYQDMAVAASARFPKSRQKVDTRLRARNVTNKHEYFTAVAQFRYIIRKVFRAIDEHAKTLGLDPLAHQALLQVYGSSKKELRVSALAERLDIAPAFASNLVKALAKAKLLHRAADASDMRVTIVRLTSAGRELCHEIDSGARHRVDALINEFVAGERKVALSSLMFYVGPDVTSRRGKRRNG
jgi:DNA-binding MarR family transcriptional regulator